VNKFLNEIIGQPEAVDATLSYYLTNDGVEKLKNLRQLVCNEQIDHIIFTGMGSSYFVSYAASCLFNSLGLRSCAINTSELLYYHYPMIDKETVVVPVSQSGESVEVVRLLEKLPKDVLCIGVSNEEHSSLTKKAKEVLLSQAGKEEMTSTKTYTSLTLVMFILGWFLANLWGEEKIRQIRKLRSGMEKLLATPSDLVTDALEFLGDIEFMQFIGRGPSFSTALQCELMFKEAARKPAAGTLGGEFRHGPMEMVGPGFTSLLFAAEGPTYSQSIMMATDTAKYEGKVVLITNKNPHGASDRNIKVITIDQPDEYLFSIQSIIPVQLIVNHLASMDGKLPGTFVHGSKVTLKE
jgi:glucosamine--fructose-6-phosphate aminotransferase (isomerizing)